MSDFVLDASALLAFVHAEPGADRVKSVLRRTVISAVNLAEVVSRLSELGGAPEEVRRRLHSLRLTVVVPVDEELGYAAGFLRRSTRRLGLSLGDRVCLALASRLDAIALTADRAWGRLGTEIRIELLRPI